MAKPVPASLCIAARDLNEPRWSPDGSLLAFTSSWAVRSAICVVPRDGGPEQAITTLPEPRAGYGGACFCWTPDGRAVIYSAKDGGLWRQGLDEPSPELLTEGFTLGAHMPSIDVTGRFVCFLDADLTGLWLLELETGDVRRVPGTGDFVVDPGWTPEGAIVWQEWSVPAMAWDESRLMRCDDPWGGSPPDCVAAVADRQVQQPRAANDGAIWSLRDDAGWLNVWRGDRPVIDEPYEHGGPTWGAGQRSYALRRDGGEVAFTRNESGFGRLCTYELATGNRRELGRGVHSQLDWHGERLAAIRSGARTPPELVVYDTATSSRSIVAVSAPSGWAGVSLVEPRSVQWPADDGTPIPGRLYPAADATGRLICWLHGGPTSQAAVSFLPRIAYWVARGWNVLVPDFRGSTGHGRAHQQAMRHRWGVVDVDDTIAGIHHAHRAGWGEPDTTVVLGGSAGGFTALHVAHRAPQRCAAVSVSFPVADLVALDATTHRFEAHYNATLVGPRPAADEEYVRRSPITFAHELTVPIQVLHGDADVVVDVAQSRDLVAALQASGGHGELHVYPGEGHGFRQPATLLDEYARVEAFIDRWTSASAPELGSGDVASPG